MKYAIIENGIVDSIVVSNMQLEVNWVAIPIGCPVYVGDKYDGIYFYDQNGNMRQTPEVSAAAARILELEEEKKLLTAQIQALTDRGEFIEDCIAEMATLLYA